MLLKSPRAASPTWQHLVDVLALLIRIPAASPRVTMEAWGATGGVGEGPGRGGRDHPHPLDVIVGLLIVLLLFVVDGDDGGAEICGGGEGGREGELSERDGGINRHNRPGHVPHTHTHTTYR